MMILFLQCFPGNWFSLWTFCSLFVLVSLLNKSFSVSLEKKKITRPVYVMVDVMLIVDKNHIMQDIFSLNSIVSF